MKYWDTSSLVPLIVEGANSKKMEALFREDPGVATWWGTRVECASAIRRREREGRLDAGEANQPSMLLETLASDWAEVQPGHEIRSIAARLLAVHPLSAGDAFQLAAAIRWASEITGGATMVTLDERLKEAASREGLICP